MEEVPLDRNGQALTGKSEPAVVLFPFADAGLADQKVADILGMSEDELHQTLAKAKTGHFTAKENQNTFETIHHKNQFFEISRNLRRIYGE